MLGHPRRAHVELLPDLLTSYQVRRVWDSGQLHDTCGYRAFITTIRDEPGGKMPAPRSAPPAAVFAIFAECLTPAHSGNTAHVLGGSPHNSG
jgi:hypothetical protein